MRPAWPITCVLAGTDREVGVALVVDVGARSSVSWRVCTYRFRYQAGAPVAQLDAVQHPVAEEPVR